MVNENSMIFQFNNIKMANLVIFYKKRRIKLEVQTLLKNFKSEPKNFL